VGRDTRSVDKNAGMWRSTRNEAVVDDRGMERVCSAVLEVQAELQAEGRVSRKRLVYLAWVIGVVFIAYGTWAVARNGWRSLLPSPSASWGSYIGPLLGPCLFWLLVWRSRFAEQRLPTKRLHAATLVSFGRCGGCGFDLVPLPVQGDGCTVCSECGAAWNRARFTRRTDGMSGREAAALAARATDRSWLVLPCAVCSDDIGIKTEIRDLPVSDIEFTGRAADARHELARLAWRRRRWLALPLFLVGIGLFVAAFVLPRINKSVEAFELGFVGVVVLIAAAVACALSIPANARRSVWLAHGVCASCAGEMERARDGFNACRVCPKCGCSWKTSDLAFPPVAVECVKCGYDRAGLAKGAPCPECACRLETAARRKHEHRRWIDA